MNTCVYLDAFEEEVARDQFTSSKGRSDALKVISQGGVVFLGGYLESGSITVLLRRNDQKYPENALEEIAVKFGVENIKKVYLTKGLNDIKSENFLKSDDGVVNGSQIERECYSPAVWSYAGEFNKTMINGLLKKE